MLVVCVAHAFFCKAADQLYGPVVSNKPADEDAVDDENRDDDFEAQMARELETLQAPRGPKGKQRLRSAKTNTGCRKKHLDRLSVYKYLK
jgi:hypothetical protein